MESSLKFVGYCCLGEQVTPGPLVAYFALINSGTNAVYCHNLSPSLSFLSPFCTYPQYIQNVCIFLHIKTQ